MTSYQGGKKRLGKRIYKIISLIESDLLDDPSHKDTKIEHKIDYLEPFIGMAGVMIHFAKEESKRKLYGSDINKDLILLWKELQKGNWKPPKKCCEKEYLKLKNSKKHSADRGFIGIVASWGCMFFHAYRLKYGRESKNYMKEGHDALMKTVPYIKNIKFSCKSYEDYDPKGLLIYCDPPYKNNKLNNQLFRNFDHEKFWEKMRKWSKNNIVIISEWCAPKDFKKIWSADSSVITNNNCHSDKDKYKKHINYI